MKKLFIPIFCLIVFSGCAANGQADLFDVENSAEEKTAEIPLIIIGEGGPSGAMFMKSAVTFQKENQGEIYEVHNGDEFIAAMKNFAIKNGKIKHLEYFGHGNQVGLYVNQAPNVNGALYANDTAQNINFISASIYELDENIFAKYAWAKFNGCNVADGFPEKDTLAQRIANYFDVDVVAPTGPTEFSASENFVNPIPNSSYLDPAFAGEVYMVPTYSTEGFVVVKPQEKSESGFVDVRIGQSYEEGVVELKERGLDLNFLNNEFFPHQNITYGEAREFCRIALGDLAKCPFSQYDLSQKIRNLKALQMLTDAHEVSLKYTDPWYASYVWWADTEKLLTTDFTTKKWYTRGEMAELTWNFIKKFGEGGLEGED